jgi:hypothetical protein
LKRRRTKRRKSDKVEELGGRCKRRRKQMGEKGEQNSNKRDPWGRSERSGREGEEDVD